MYRTHAKFIIGHFQIDSIESFYSISDWCIDQFQGYLVVFTLFYIKVVVELRFDDVSVFKEYLFNNDNISTAFL